MQMTKGEITANYRQAKNKMEQMKILAELNTTDVQTIYDIIVEGGINPSSLNRAVHHYKLVPHKAPKKPGRPKKNETETISIATHSATVTDKIVLPINDCLEIIRTRIADIDKQVQSLEEEKANIRASLELLLTASEVE